MITKLTDAEISRWIAEKLEPLIEGIRWKRLNGVIVSFGGMWTAGDGWDRMPRDPVPTLNADMVNDPAMTVMLLQKLIAEGNPIYGSRYERERYTDIVIQLGEGKASTLVCNRIEQLGRAVAEAFMLANGYQS